MTNRTRLLVGGAGAAALGFVVGIGMYGEWYLACCAQRLSIATAIAFMPAYGVAILIGGGVETASPLDFKIGMAVQFLAVWGLFRWFWHIRLRRRRRIGIEADRGQ